MPTHPSRRALVLAAAVAAALTVTAAPAAHAAAHAAGRAPVPDRTAREHRALARADVRTVHGRNLRGRGARAASAGAPAVPAAPPVPTVPRPGDAYDVVASFDAGKLLWHDLQTGERGAFPQATADFNAQPVVATDDSHVAYDALTFLDDDHFSSGIAVLAPDGTKSVQLTNYVDALDVGAQDTNDNPDAFSPDGSTIYYDHEVATNTADGGDTDQSIDVRSVPVDGGDPTTVVTDATSATFDAAGRLLYVHTDPSVPCFLDAGLGAGESCVLTRAALAAALPAGTDPATVMTDAVRTFGTDGYAFTAQWGTEDAPASAVVVGHGGSVRVLPGTLGSGIEGLVNVDPTGTEVVYAAVAPDFSSGLTVGVDTATGRRLATIETQSDEAGLSVWYGTQSPTPSAYQPVSPVRVLDTRTGLGAARRPVAAGTPLDVAVTGGHGVPADATAVTGTLTAVAPTASTYLAAFATPAAGVPVPVVSPLQVAAHRSTAVLDTVPVGADGRIRIAVGAGATDVAFDLTGYYVPAADGGGSTYVPVTPVSLGSSVIAARGSRDLAVTGVGGVPAGGVSAVVLGVTASASATTFLSAYPTPTTASAPPAVSFANLVAGERRDALAVVAVPASGRVRLYNAAGSTGADVRIVGYYTAGRAGALYVPLRPYRVFDSRVGLREAGGAAPVGTGGTDLLATGRITTADGTALFGPGGVVAVQYALQAVAPAATTALSAGGVEAVEVTRGTVVADAAVVPVGDDGTVHVGSTGPVAVIADAEGWFVRS